MHKLHECVTKEINDIVEHGITKSNIGVLGELVDIVKDIEEIWHWRGYRETDIKDYNESNMCSTSIDELISNIKSIDAKLKTSSNPELASKLKESANELYGYAEKIKHTFETVKFDSEMVMKFKNLYK